MKLEISFLQSLSKKHPRWRCMMLHFSCHCSNCDFLSASMHPQLHSLSYWKVGWVFWSLSQPWKSRALQSSPSAQWLHVHQWFPVKSPWSLHFDESTSIFCWYCSTPRFQALRSSHFNLHKEDSATPVNSGAALVRPPWTHGPTVKSLGCNSDRLILQLSGSPAFTHSPLFLTGWPSQQLKSRSSIARFYRRKDILNWSQERLQDNQNNQ